MWRAHQIRRRFHVRFIDLEKSRVALSWKRYFAVQLLCTLMLPAMASAAQTLSEPQVMPETADSAMNDQVRQHHWPVVAALAQERIQRSSKDVIALYWLGTARLQLGDFIGSEQAFRSAEKFGMDSSLLHEGLGLAYFRLNQFFLFEQEMKRASEQDPKDLTPNYYLGLYHLTIRSDISEALHFLDQATQLQPNDWKSLYEEGNCFEKLGKSTEARQYYIRSAEAVQKSGQPFGWPFQGLARLALQDDAQQALGFARKAVQVEPGEYSNHLILAKVYKNQGNLADAIKEAREATAENPTDAPSRYLLFLLYRQDGEREAAQQQLKMFQTLTAVYGPD